MDVNYFSLLDFGQTIEVLNFPGKFPNLSEIFMRLQSTLLTCLCSLNVTNFTLRELYVFKYKYIVKYVIYVFVYVA